MVVQGSEPAAHDLPIPRDTSQPNIDRLFRVGPPAAPPPPGAASDAESGSERVPENVPAPPTPAAEEGTLPEAVVPSAKPKAKPAAKPQGKRRARTLRADPSDAVPPAEAPAETAVPDPAADEADAEAK